MPAAQTPTWAEAGLELLDGLVAKAIVAIMGVMVAIVSAQVALRYGLNDSIDWADEISRLCFVWSIFLAFPLGIKRGAHIGIELLTMHLPGRVQRVLYRAMALLSAVLMGLIAIEAFVLTRDQWDELMPTVNASVAWFMVPIWFGAAHSILHLLRLAARGAPVKHSAITE